MTTIKKTRREDTLTKKILENRDPIKKKQVHFRMNIACALDDLLKSRNMSGSDLARKMDKHPSEISKWLSGTQNFTQDILVEIANALEYELAIPFLNPISL